MHTVEDWEYWFEATGAGAWLYVCCWGWLNACCWGCADGYELVCCGYPVGGGCRKFIAAEAAYAIP